MSVTHSLTRRGPAAALALVTATVLGAGAAGASSAAPAAAPRTRQIATSVLGGDYRFSLTAVRSTGDEYAASVRLKVYTRTSGGAWKETDRATVGAVDGWFWYPLTGKGAVCRFSTSAAEPAPIEVSLLVTPSIGCSAPQRFVVERGRIHAD
ncbi:hypothetical protein [Streptomyces carpinensis]|uniref:Secreted protein n=1 Tax=Streptomyces carpinensis TaxID=66369 RepID=A0ABV1W1F7_9ACTN|nr:hypothetical protein [Streptomyces carpinensis]